MGFVKSQFLFSRGHLMALVLNQQVVTTLPIEVSGICPDRLVGQSLSEIKKLTIGFGNRDIPLSEMFDVSGALQTEGDDEPTIRWTGNLTSVHWLGSGMKSGRMVVEASVGRHLGSQMSGGTIEVTGNVSDHAGAEMKGGTIRIAGNTGDLAGANYPGSKYGMNHGQIFISGDAGKGIGQKMRRGTIVIGGDCGPLVGWDMLAGTIIVLGRCEGDVGINMSRGTLVIAGATQSESMVPPTFSRGITDTVPLFRLMSNWLKQLAPEFDTSSLTKKRFTQYHGDALRESRGEVFIATEK